MKKLILSLLIINGSVFADNIEGLLEPGIVIKNVHGVLESGTWFNLSLMNNIKAKKGTQPFTAYLTEPIYNANFDELLVPVNSIATGSYVNNGESCTLLITDLKFNNQTIKIDATNYTNIVLPLPNMLSCDAKKDYLKTQIIDFRSNKDIQVQPFSYNRSNTVAYTNDTYVQTFGKQNHKKYIITKIINYTNGLVDVTVKFNDPEYIDRFIPVFYDNYEIPHAINYMKRLDYDTNEVSYVFTSRYSKFGFAITGK